MARLPASTLYFLYMYAWQSPSSQMGFFIGAPGRAYHVWGEIGSMSKKKTYLTVEEVAMRFGVNTATVYRLAQQGKLPGFKVGAQWRFSAEMLERWVMDHIMVDHMKAEDRKHFPPQRAEGTGT